MHELLIQKIWIQFGFIDNFIEESSKDNEVKWNDIEVRKVLSNVRDFIDCPFNCYNVGQVLAQGSGGCIGRSFAEPAARALAEVLQQLHDAPGDPGKLFQEMESVLRLLKGPGSLEIIDDEECENEGDEEEQAQPESSD